MPVSRQHIIDEIKRTAGANSGKPLGTMRFEKETGIRKSDWYGVHWANWGDAVSEAGFQANEFQSAYEEQYLIEQLIELIRDLNKWPVEAEIRMKTRRSEGFPSHSAFLKLGGRSERLQKVLDYSRTRPDFEDVIAICEPLVESETDAGDSEADDEIEFGFVYLMKSGRNYKIGYTNALGRREYELSIQLPERLTTVHVIKTDDPAGIEAYWHRRFEDKRKNGEWFELNTEDIRAFKRRKFM